MVDWSDPATFELNVMNAVLGAVVAIALALLVGAVVIELLARLRERAIGTSADRADAHTFLVPELGPTMADGGEPTRDEDGKG